jgi:hypothetical protein
MFLLLIVYNNAISQISERTLNNAGGQASNANFYVDFSIGEPMIYEYKSNIFVTEGVLQPLFKSITSTENIIYKIDLFPNPADNELFVLLDNANDFIIHIVDIHGRVYFLKISDKNSIDISNLAPGIYLLDAFDNISKKIFQSSFIKI